MPRRGPALTSCRSRERVRLRSWRPGPRGSQFITVSISSSTYEVKITVTTACLNHRVLLWVWGGRPMAVPAPSSDGGMKLKRSPSCWEDSHPSSKPQRH